MRFDSRLAVCAAIGLWHIRQSALLILHPETTKVASMHLLDNGHPFVYLAMLFSGLLACLALAAQNGRMIFFLLLGQQAVLLSTALGAGMTIAAQAYPDGTASPTITRAFLEADQSVHVLLSVLHLILMFGLLKNRERPSA